MIKGSCWICINIALRLKTSLSPVFSVCFDDTLFTDVRGAKCWSLRRMRTGCEGRWEEKKVDYSVSSVESLVRWHRGKSFCYPPTCAWIFFSFYVCSFGETKRLSTYSIFIQCIRKILSENLADTAKVPVRANSRNEVPIQTWCWNCRVGRS